MQPRETHRHHVALFAITLWMLWGCTLQTAPPTPSSVSLPAFSVSPWPQADALFHNDPRWRGADDAYSIDLHDGRVLWLFGDSLITDPPQMDRPKATLIRNSIAIQKGYNPALSDVKFYWRGTRAAPSAFFPVDDQTWLWPGDGERMGEKLILFFMEIEEADNPLGFELVGWRAMMVSNPDAPPLDWEMQWLDTPSNDFKAIVGSGSVFIEGQHLYALAYQEHSRAVLLARWALAAAQHGDLSVIQWWGGPDLQWVAQNALNTPPPAIFSDGQAELTVHFDLPLKRYLGFQSVGFGPAHVAMRQAPRLAGPWSAATAIHHPSEQIIPEVMIYAAKAHPHLTGGDLVLTYCTNSFVYENVLNDKRLYYPRFLKLTRPR